MANRTAEGNMQSRAGRERSRENSASASRERDMRIQIKQHSGRRRRETENLELTRFSGKQKKEMPPMKNRRSRQEEPEQKKGAEKGSCWFYVCFWC